MNFINLNGNTPGAMAGSNLVIAGDWGYITGISPIDIEKPESSLPELVEAQTRKLFKNLDQILDSNKLNKSSVVSIRVNIINFDRLCDRVLPIIHDYFMPGQFPGISCNGVLANRRGAQVEMDFILYFSN
jgi:enamine deaminase RidA (YjgF/YER057c/UK114 family)